MKVLETSIKDCYIIQWDKYNDRRGHFQVPFNLDEFTKVTGIEFNICQENESFSKKNVIR